MDQIVTVIKSALKPIQTAYYNAFNANKYAAGIGLICINYNYRYFL